MFQKKIQRKNIAETFSDRAQKMGFPPDKLFYLISSLQKQINVSNAEKEDLNKLLSKAPGLKNFKDLKNSEIYLLNSLLTRIIEVNILGQNDSPNFKFILFCRRWTFSVLGILMTVFLAYALLSGYSNFPYFQEHNVRALIYVSGLIGFLFLLEGTQISVTSLRLKDLDTVDGVSNQVRALHSNYRSHKVVQQYLAGRQLLTIVTVFFISRICSFPNLTLIPLLNYEIPTVIKTIFLDLGILAALVTLWLGQLAPQFWANKQPIKFLAFPLSQFVIFASRVVEALGITDFGNMITSRIKEEDEIPTSRRDIFNSYKANQAYSAIGVVVRYNVNEKDAAIEVVEDFIFDHDSQDHLQVQEIFQSGAEGKETRFKIIRDDEEIPNYYKKPETLIIDNDEYLAYLVAPLQTHFKKNDLLIKKLKLKVNRNAPSSRQINILKPIRYLLVTIEARKEVKLGTPILEGLEKNIHDNGNLHSPILHQINKIYEEDGISHYALFIPFPDASLLYNVKWEKKE